MGSNQNKNHHHILPTKTAFGLGACLLVLTVITVAIAYVDLGRLNFVIAMLVATVKAMIVALYFMGLKFDRRENAMIFATSFVFLAIFMILVSTDLFFRPESSHVRGPLVMNAAPGVSKYKKPWISTPELIAKGKELFEVQCASCHGKDGQGDGPAASALNPHPRNFHHTDGWKNGRKPTMVFKTLKEGLPPSAMASYATLHEDDRWAMTQYVLSLAANPEKDTDEDYKKIGVDPTKDSMGAKIDPTIPIGYALELMAEAEPKSALFHGCDKGNNACPHPGSKIYESQCIRCHGALGKGGIRVKNLGIAPHASFVTTSPLSESRSMQSFDQFQKIVIQGIQTGEIMPSNADLTHSEHQELYEYVKGLSTLSSKE